MGHFSLDIAPDVETTAQKQETRPTGSAWRVYWRLILLATHYKKRLAVAVVFAFVVAASFGSMLIGMGAVVDLTFYTPQYDSAGKVLNEDPATQYAEKIREKTADMERHFGWAPQGLDTRFEAMVAGMREQKMRAIVAMCAIVVCMALLINIARFIQEYFAGTIGAYITTDLGRMMYANMMRQSVGFFERRTTGEIVARFTNDIFMVERGLSGVFVKVMREPIKAVVFLAVAFSSDFWLTLVGVCVLPPVIGVLIFIGKLVRSSVRNSLQKVGSMAAVVSETLRGIVIIKGYTMEDYEIRRVNGEIDKLRRFLFQMVRLNALTDPATEFLLVLGVSGFVLYCGYQIVTGALEPGGLFKVFFALALILDPIRKLSSVNNLIQTSVASAERVFEFVDLTPDIEEAPDAVALPPMRASLRFEDVHFTYDGRAEVLRGLDLEIRKGEMVAIVGFSGAGKSTLVKLIPRFYDVTSGAVRIDGVDIRGVTFRSLREQIGIVTQDVVLFAETVRENIAYGETKYDDDRVEGAARAAHAHEFIQGLPKGYDTAMSESGVNLSGGQRQRLAIARAIVKDPAILILDEATSSLDSESERLIQAALDEFVAGRTALVIAHRLSTIQRADRIVVLDEGRVAEQGTHAELMATGGIYQRLYETQFGPSATPREPA